VELRDYLRTLRKRWLLVGLCIVLGLGAAVALAALATPQYTSSTTAFVSSREGGENISDTYQGGLFTQERVASYAEVAGSRAVTDAVARDLGLPESEVADKVSASSPRDTVLIDITCTDESAGRAQEICSAVAQEVVTLVPRLEAAPGAATSPVKLTIVDPASEPHQPSWPRPKIILPIGVLLGLAAGLGLAVLVETLDTRVKSKGDLQLITGSAPLGVIAEDAGVSARPLVVHRGSPPRRAEAFRQLRTHLQYADVDHPPRSLVITSAIAGEGKTTTTCNLAIIMAEAGLRTVVVDADMRRPRLASTMGVESAVGLTSVLSGTASLAEVLQPWGKNPLWVLPTGPLPPNPSEILGSRQMRDLLATLVGGYDVVLMDAPPLLPVTDAAVLARETDGAVLVVQAGRTKRDQVVRCLEALRGVDSRLVGTVVNRAPRRGPDAEPNGADAGYGYYASVPGAPTGSSVVPVPNGSHPSGRPVGEGRRAPR
jgi:non-specific protein-tyrosine kinase